MPGSPVRLTDLSLRSLGKLEPPSLASWERLAPALRALDSVGFQSIEAWGDLTFDRCLEAIRESPWERLSRLAGYITETPLQMEIRGRCLLGSRPFRDDVVRAFIEQANESGIGVFSVYEPLNDVQGLESVAAAVRATKARLVLGLVVSQRADEAIAEHAALAGVLADMSPDAICLRTAEAVIPGELALLVERVVGSVSVPVEVCVDNAGALGTATVLAALRAGAVAAHASVAPSWFDPSSVPLASLLPLLGDGGWVVDVDEDSLAAAGMALAQVAHDGDMLSCIPSVMHDASLVDWRDLARVPADVVWQVGERLRSLEATGRLREVIAEIAKVRQEIGDPALVPPVAQIVATQAVLNVIYQRRWQVVPDEMKAYLRGQYGRPPRSPVDHVADLASEGALLDEGPQSTSVSLDALTNDLGDLSMTPADTLLYALAPASGRTFLEARRAALDVQALFDPVEYRDSVAGLQDHWEDLGPEKVSQLMDLVEGSTVDELVIESHGTRIVLRKGSQPTAAAATPPMPAVADASAGLPAEIQDESQATVVASMVGTFYRSPAPGVPPYVEVGSRVERGDALCVLEAMKLMNEQLSEVSGEISAILVEDGAAVEYGQPLFLVRLDSE